MDKGKIVRKGVILILSFLLLLNLPPSMEKGENRTVIFASDSDVFYTLLATPLAVMETSPILLFNGNITSCQSSFLSSYGATYVVGVGAHLSCAYPKREFVGNIDDISLQIASLYGAEKAVLVPHSMKYYRLSLLATQIASYEKIPLIVYDDVERVEEGLKSIGIRDIICIVPLNISGFNMTLLDSEDSLYSHLMKLGDFSYVALTNPRDAISTEPEREKREYAGHINNLKITFLAREINILGNDSQFFEIHVPEGFNIVRIYVNISSPSSGIPCIISASIYRGKDLITYSFSNAYEEERCLLEFPAINAAGNYTLKVSIYRGIKGGFFSQRGISIVDADFYVDAHILNFAQPHLPTMPLSSLAPYLASLRNGVVVSVENGVESFLKNVSVAGGAWNNPWMHKNVNYLVNKSVERLKEFSLGYDMEIKYVALVGDVNMLPRYYYKSFTGDAYVGYGIPSDNPYSLNFSAAVGRIMGMNMEDVSMMISRELFYGDLIGDLINKFNFITGEGFGETAAIFHQIPYSRELRKRGFETHLFGILRNGREWLERGNAFDAAFVEYEGHGDWYWMLSSIYGFDYYSRVVDVAHVKNYVFPPNVILTAACLMGRMDGIPPESSISMAFLHAGSVAVISATRETGGEATLEIIESELLFNHSCMGDAFIKSNMVTGEPTKYARVLYGDPAFVPFPSG